MPSRRASRLRVFHEKALGERTDMTWCRIQYNSPKFYLMLLADVALFIASLFIAYLIRFEFSLTPYLIDQIRTILVVLIPVKMVVFAALGLYDGMWRYTGLRDMFRLLQACMVCFLAVIAMMVYLHRFQDNSRAVFVVDAALTFFMTGGLRIAIRTGFALRSHRTNFKEIWFPWTDQKTGRKVIIIGAGDAGEKILREIQGSSRMNYHVACFLDDQPEKQGRTLHGVPVTGPIISLPEIAADYDVKEVFIAMPSASGAQTRRIVEICEKANVSFKTLPALGDIMDGKVSIQTLRNVDYEDLLGRSPVEIEREGIACYLQGKRVLVTGCGGSIGSELCRQIIGFNPAHVVLLDAGESNLYQIQMELQHEKKFSSYAAVLGRVEDRRLLEGICRQYHPEVVFHAAAYKHVPMLELNPWEAVVNNILGSQVVMDVARECGAERFVLVSTDKAVCPTNVMGASKRVSELILQSQPAGKTKFMAVRFGNVLGSAGSVVPLFRRQIEKGGPVTVTHPDVTRYFMTIPEACQLILQAGALGEGGEIFILEMGIPVKIADMALDLIRLSGKEPGCDIEVIFTGLREGEKLYEELITEGEDVISTRHSKIKMLRPDREEMRDIVATGRKLAFELPVLLQLAANHDAPAIKKKLHELVPEYAVQSTPAVLSPELLQ